MRRLRRGSRMQALLMAGLCLLGQLRAETPLLLPPGRQVTTPIPSPTPEVRAEDLKRLREHSDEAQAAIDKRVRDLDQRLSGAARVKDEDLRALRQTLEQSTVDLRAMDIRLGSLERGQKTHEETLVLATKELSALSVNLKTARDELATALKQAQATQTELKARSDKLEDLVDLLGALRRDLNTNNEEIVDLRRQLKALDGKGTVEGSNAQWWDQALRWPYLPALATGLAAIAIGVAASK